MTTALQAETEDGVRLRIVYDEDPMSPREWSNLGTILYGHRNYVLGEVRVKSEEEVYQHIGSELNLYQEYFENDKKWMEAVEERTVILPVFLFDHSGISISTSSRKFRLVDNAGWDWGQVGVIYITLDKLEHETGWGNPESREKIKKRTGANTIREYGEYLLENEIEVFDQFVQGDVYGFVLEKKEVCDCCGNVEWELLDSCFGFFGQDWEENGLADHIPEEHRYLLKEVEHV